MPVVRLVHGLIGKPVARARWRQKTSLMLRGMVVCRPLLSSCRLPPLVTVMFVGSPVVKQKLQAHEGIWLANEQVSQFAADKRYLSSMQWFRQL